MRYGYRAMDAQLRDLIERRIDDLGITLAEAERRCGLPTDGIRNVLRGKPEYSPRIKTLRAIARGLDLPEIVALEANGSLNGTATKPSYSPTVPAGTISLIGTFIGADSAGDFDLSGVAVESRPSPSALATVKDAFGFYVIGDQMSPRVEPGDVVYIHPGKPVKPGDLVLILFRDDSNDRFTGPAVIRTLLTETSEYVRVLKLNPLEDKKRIPRGEIKAIYKVALIEPA